MLEIQTELMKVSNWLDQMFTDSTPLGLPDASPAAVRFTGLLRWSQVPDLTRTGVARPTHVEM